MPECTNENVEVPFAVQGWRRILLAVLVTCSSYTAFLVLIALIALVTSLKLGSGAYFFIVASLIIALVGCYLGTFAAPARCAKVRRALVPCGVLAVLAGFTFDSSTLGLIALVFTLNAAKGSMLVRWLNRPDEVRPASKKRHELAISGVYSMEALAVVMGTWMGV